MRTMIMPDEPQELQFDDDMPNQIPPSQATYNIVTDLVSGVNVRKSDNIFQLKCIVISVLALAALGAGLAAWNVEWELPWFAGALLGAFAGLVVGVFTSGIFLMVYRAVQHMKGKHD